MIKADPNVVRYRWARTLYFSGFVYGCEHSHALSNLYTFHSRYPSSGHGRLTNRNTYVTIKMSQAPICNE